MDENRKRTEIGNLKKNSVLRIKEFKWYCIYNLHSSINTHFFSVKFMFIWEFLWESDFDFVVDKTLFAFLFEKQRLFLFPNLQIFMNFLTSLYPLVNGSFTMIAKYFYNKNCLSLIISGCLFVFLQKWVLGNSGSSSLSYEIEYF